MVGAAPAVAFGLGWALESLVGPFFALRRVWLFVPAGLLATAGLVVVNGKLTGFVAMTPWIVVAGYWIGTMAHVEAPDSGTKCARRRA
jgi:predicted ABC-type sugar transport system permease subunit